LPAPAGRAALFVHIAKQVALLGLVEVDALLNLVDHLPINWPDFM
jgi:hypothetical protein